MKKGQIWTIDLIIGSLLFFLILITSIDAITSLGSDDEFETLLRSASHASNMLSSAGSPSNWNSTNVVVPGLITNNKLDESKLESFEDLSYEYAKHLMLLEGDYIFVFKKNETLNITNCGYGFNITYDENCLFNLEELNYDHLVISKRYLIYNSEFIEMVLYVWK